VTPTKRYETPHQRGGEEMINEETHERYFTYICIMNHEKNNQIKCEILFDIVGYEGLYSVSKDAKVYSWKTKKYLKPQLQNNGYVTVGLYLNKKSKVIPVHRIVAQAFLPNPLSLRTVNHKDFDKTNNNVSNLEWMTHQENSLHSTNRGIVSGENNGNSKLTKQQVIEIRQKYKFRKYTYLDLSKEYGVLKTYVGRIINRQVWNHI
jgi:hypothetical protein